MGISRAVWPEDDTWIFGYSYGVEIDIEKRLHLEKEVLLSKESEPKIWHDDINSYFITELEGKTPGSDCLMDTRCGDAALTIELDPRVDLTPGKWLQICVPSSQVILSDTKT